MKKAIYLLGALVIALNLFFSVTLENNIAIDSANADVDENCGYLVDTHWGFNAVYLSPCLSGGEECGTSTICEPQTNTLCNAWQCYVEV
jgi:hypothetical protein